MINHRHIIRLLRFPTSGCTTGSYPVSRPISTTSLALKSADDKALRTTNLDLDKKPQDDESLGSSKGPTAVAKIELPDENPDIPKKHVFQQLTVKRLTDSYYTLEEASKYVSPMNTNKYYKYQALAENMGNFEYALRSHENEHTVIFQFPDVTDFLVVGSGLIGSAFAYYSKYKGSRTTDICIIDKEPYSPHNCTAISNGLISSQSMSEDVVRIAQLSKELIRDLKNDIVCTKEDFANINYRPVTHLVLYREDQAEEALESVSMQLRNQCYNEARLPDQIQQTFPFLSFQDSDVALGVYGNQDEALVDPIALRNLFRTLAQAHGANFIRAEAIDFNMIYRKTSQEIDQLAAGALVARIDNGELKNVHYANAVLCLGHNTPFLEAQAEMEEYYRDAYDDLHFLQPKMRLTITFNSQETPVINFPVITDTDGSQLISEDSAGNFKYYLNLEESEKLLDEDCDKYMDVSSSEPYPNLIHKGEEFKRYFETIVKPKLIKRVPSMEDSTFLFAQSGFESWNTYDGNPIMSQHPFFMQLLMSGGYGNRLSTFGPLAGFALSEISYHDEAHTFDIQKFYWDRVFKGVRMKEFPQILGGFEQL